ncbi:MAG: thioredoxin family protein [Alphaproteobacteria bacterium]|nr:thioredoxin family protein [Alphaproteobacteria bacterium]
MSQTAVKDQNNPVQLGWQAADFRLKGTDGKFYTLADVRGPKGLLVMFICNHCPYVKGALDRIIRDVTELKALGINAVGIMPNDVVNYPDDSFENMQKLVTDKRLPFPYVIDETQEVARAYDAACTPEFYGFNASLRLAYHGRIDAGGKNVPPPGSSRELFEAMKLIAEAGVGPSEQHASIGCSVKWKR